MSAIAFSVMYCILVISFLLSQVATISVERTKINLMLCIVASAVQVNSVFVDVHIMHMHINDREFLFSVHHIAFRMADALKIFA